MKDGQRLIVKYINGPDDLPKVKKRYFCYDKYYNQIDCFTFYLQHEYALKEECEKEYWLKYVDWYIILEEQEPVTDTDIEAWADKKVLGLKGDPYIRTLYEGLIEGAKAALNGEIKHIL